MKKDHSNVPNEERQATPCVDEICSCNIQSSDVTFSHHESNVVSLSSFDRIDNRQEQQGTIIISSKGKEHSFRNNKASTDNSFNSLTRMSFIVSEACSCSVSDLLSKMSRELPSQDRFSEDSNGHTLKESVDGDLIIIDQVSSNHSTKDEKESTEENFKTESLHGTEVWMDSERDDFHPRHFERIGKSLCQDSKSCADLSDMGDDESTQFSMKECSELDTFIDAAEEILPHLLENDRTSRNDLPLPPLPPTDFVDDLLLSPQLHHLFPTIDLNSVIPSEFICPLCQLPIVGAVTFRCVQQQNFCISCVEQCLMIDTHVCKNTEIQTLDYCPSCDDKCHYVSCHALDVAIFMFIRDLDLRFDVDKYSLKLFQDKFYSRLFSWRKQVLRRNAVPEEEKNQELLLEYAKHEKEELKKYHDLLKCEESIVQNQWINIAAVVTVPLMFFIGSRVVWRLR